MELKGCDFVYFFLVCLVAYFVTGCTATLRLDSNESESKVVSYREPAAVSGRGENRWRK